MELFDFINSLFDKNEYKKASKSIKRKHAFITLRIIANKYPDTIQKFNIIGIDQTLVLDYIHTTLSGRFTRKPNWLFLKGKRKDQSKIIEKIKSFSKELKNFVLNKYEISEKDFEFWINVDSDSVLSELKKYEKLEKEKLISLK